MRVKNNSITTVLFFFGMFLNMQKTISGINFSVSDFLLIYLMLVFIIKKNFFIPKNILLFIVLLYTLGLMTTLFVIRPEIGLPINLKSFLLEYVKVSTGFLYFISALIIGKFYQLKILLQGFVYGATIIAMAAIAGSIFKIAIFNSELFYEGPRFIGLFNDPNYFSIVSATVVCIIVFDYENILEIRWKYFQTVIIILAVIFSASKTGLILILVTLTIKICLNLVTLTIKSLVTFVIVSVMVGIGYYKFENVTYYLNKIALDFPTLKRLILIFTNTELAFSGDGSNRTHAWSLGLSLIERYPLLGVGIGNYSDTLYYFTGSRGLSHNSYIQVAAEWGIPLAVIFYATIFINTFKSFFYGKGIIMIAMFVLLIGSMSVSLNNSRVFWFGVGITYIVNFMNKPHNSKLQ